MWSLIGSDFLHHPATGVALVAGLLFLASSLTLRVVGLLLAFRLSRKAIEQGYPVEAAAGREFYFRIPAREVGPRNPSKIKKPRSTAAGARVRALREARSCTLAKLSVGTKIAASRLSAFETGRAQILDSDIDLIAQILHLTDEDTAGLKRLAELDAETSPER